jgi:hypothetical protein
MKRHSLRSKALEAGDFSKSPARPITTNPLTNSSSRKYSKSNIGLSDPLIRLPKNPIFLDLGNFNLSNSEFLPSVLAPSALLVVFPYFHFISGN